MPGYHTKKPKKSKKLKSEAAKRISNKMNYAKQSVGY